MPPANNIRSLLRQSLGTLLFYAAAVALVWLGEQAGPSGPCTPGLGFLFGLILLPLLAAGLLLRSLVLDIIGPSPRRLSPRTVIHGLAVTTFIVFLFG